jgi:hypothetical protein
LEQTKSVKGAMKRMQSIKGSNILENHTGAL